jgi:eukaryotic-like serine/threonine-protein kinase
MNSDAIRLFRELAGRSASEREAYYAQHQTDGALRAEVESLLTFDSPNTAPFRGAVNAAAEVVVDQSDAALLTGHRLGAFEVEDLLGIGGMGEVYRARDMRLGRHVAIKIIRRDVRDEQTYIARFEREAHVLASLNHPHIGVIHGFEEVAGLKILVMELVAGEDLAERLAHGPLPITEALDVARQVADALEAAHAQGIVHRDLKPANIKRRPDGRVKVLDFGMAKPLERGVEDATVTRPGLVAGTPAYMSPEQARGEPLDTQTDVWSFGVVLFELLTGRAPFVGKTAADTIASVLSESSDYSLLPPATPAVVRHLIRRCLERDRRRRLKHIGDARIELEEALSPAVDTTQGPLQPVTAANRAARNMRRAAVVVAAASLVGAGAATVWLARRAALPVVQTIIPADTAVGEPDRSFAFTPDGTGLAYISSDGSHIFVRSLDRLEPIPILKTAAYLRGLFPSHDGRWFAYVEDAFTLKKISVSGGPPVTVVVMDGPSRGAAWGPDDTLVFATGATDTGLQRVAATGGTVTVLTRPNRERGEGDHVNPVWLPGGRALLFTILPAQGGLDAAKVAVLDLATGHWRTVLEGAHAARYVDTGHLVYAASDALWATRFDLARLEPQGTPVEMLRPVSINELGATAEFDISSNGTLAYSRGATEQGSRVQPVWVDRKGHETPVPMPPDPYRHLRLSPDGKRLALSVGGDLYVWELTRPWSAEARKTFSPAIDWFPVWTPDSRRIVFGSWRGGKFSNLYMLDADTGSTERLTDSPEMQLPTAMTRDGTTVIFHSFTRNLQALRLRAPAQPQILVETPGEERNGEVSPDGAWLAYEGESTSHPGQLDIYVRPFPAVDRGLWEVTKDGGMYPVWSPDGGELFYMTLDGAIVAVPVEASGTTWKAGTPKKLFHGQYLIRDGSLGRSYDIARDGRFLMLKQPASSEAPHFVIVQNWVAELARQVR